MAEAGTPSAVLLALFEREENTYIWLMRRTVKMRNHSGQVAFPGGKRDASDASLLHTALREAHEEVGIQPTDVDVLGPLDDLVTVTGYVISPYVAWVPEATVPVPNVEEVARVFCAPLAAFLDEPVGSAARLSRLGYAIEGEFVWGATAAIAQRLGTIVRSIVSQDDDTPRPSL